MDKPQSDALKHANEALARQYDVSGYPSLILLNRAGEQVDKRSVGYSDCRSSRISGE